MRGRVAKAIRRMSFDKWMELSPSDRAEVGFRRTYRSMKRLYKELRRGEI